MIKLRDILTEISNATSMSEKQWMTFYPKMKPNRKIIIQYKNRKGKNVRGFFVVKKSPNVNTVQLGKQKPKPKEFNNYELKWNNNKVWLWAAMGYAKNRTDAAIKDIILR